MPQHGTGTWWGNFQAFMRAEVRGKGHVCGLCFYRRNLYTLATITTPRRESGSLCLLTVYGPHRMLPHVTV